MQWQDYVFTIGQFIFLVALIPTIKGKDKPALSTSVATTLILLVFVYTYFSLKLLLSATASLSIAIAWGTLAVQKYLQDKK